LPELKERWESESDEVIILQKRPAEGRIGGADFGKKKDPMIQERVVYGIPAIDNSLETTRNLYNKLMTQGLSLIVVWVIEKPAGSTEATH